jgi:dihydropteroate synthase-like protein
MTRPQIHFVTGKLAEHALRKVLADMALNVEFDATIGVLNITVAALLTTPWIARRLEVPLGTTKIMLPGYCQGDLSVLEQAIGLPVERGPKDLRMLPEYFGTAVPSEYGRYNIEILAEINHAPRWKLNDLLDEADRLRLAGADLIDLGCDPGDAWSEIDECVGALRDRGHRVSIDSYNPKEIEPAVRAGAELVLSVNESNRRAALDWGCEVVVVPDVPGELHSLDETIELLSAHGVPLRIDPVLEPIGFGFAASLERYQSARRTWPDAEMMMGIGNLTELTDADSAAINVLLLAICQELGIHSVLTTQVIHWAQTSVRECDLARRLVYHAIHEHALPKHLEPRLVMLRDPRPLVFGQQELAMIASQLKDNNVRIFAEEGQLHLMTAGLHLQGDDPFALFDQLLAHGARNVDASHAFYLGYEMAKAVTALTLGKDYRQDEALQWGLLTRPEQSHRARDASGQEPG